MKAAVYVDKNIVKLMDMPIKDINPNQIRIKVKYCAMCATDVHVVTQGLYGMPKGIIIGHEASGTVIQIGENAKDSGLKIGDRVAACPLKFCGKCKYCKKGLVMHCINGFDVNAEPFDSMAEYRNYYPDQLHLIPETIGFEEATLIEPTSSAIRAMDLANMSLGDSVALSGVGGIGIILLQLIKLQGGTRITVIEPIESKRKLALELGADYAINPFEQDIIKESMRITDNMGFDFVFEASGVPKAAPPCLKIVGKGGCVVYFAVYPAEYELPVNLFEMYSKEARIQTVFTSPYIFPRSLELIPKLNLKKVIGAIYPLDDIEKAFDVFLQSKYPKILIKC